MSDPHGGIDAGADRRPPWQATVLTLFPEMFPGSLGLSLAGKALAAERWDLQTVNIRDYALNRHRSVDDTAFGGGSGMGAGAALFNRQRQLRWAGPCGQEMLKRCEVLLYAEGSAADCAVTRSTAHGRDVTGSE